MSTYVVLHNGHTVAVSSDRDYATERATLTSEVFAGEVTLETWETGWSGKTWRQSTVYFEHGKATHTVNRVG